jgi:Mn-containing catalase
MTREVAHQKMFQAALDAITDNFPSRLSTQALLPPLVAALWQSHTANIRPARTSSLLARGGR